MKYEFKFGSSVTVIPAAATEKILSGAATPEETAVLLAVAGLSAEAETEAEYLELISEITGLDADTVKFALAFWRGASVISVTGKSKKLSSAEKKTVRETEPELRATQSESGTGDDGKETVSVSVSAHAPGALSAPGASAGLASDSGEASAEAAPKPLMREELPKYDPETISRICGRDGGALREVIDQCQQIVGRMFNPTETAKIVALNDYLGLDPEYILMLFAYYSKKKPGCKIHYIEKTAYSLVNDGIVTPIELDSHIKSLEIYDGVAGNLRRLLGIGGRAFTKKENTKISHWINDFGYGSELIEFCYETTVNNIGEFSFDYADKMMEGWYTEGVRGVDGAKAAIEKYRLEHERKPNAGSTGGITESTFDGDEFLALAIKRSMGAANSDNRDEQ
ncbi:MAG: DnaD domain protein [Clostridia bacterium]|nr:DnaD domain protein [Clostridia bacterium]